MPDDDSIGLKLRALKDRSGLTLSGIATVWGGKKRSTVQRYFEPEFRPGGLLDIEEAIELAEVFAGKGDPPISIQELLDLTALPRLPEGFGLTPLEPPVAQEIAEVVAQVALQGRKPSADVTAMIAKILVEVTEFYQREPGARLDPGQTRGALRVLVQQLAKQESEQRQA